MEIDGLKADLVLNNKALTEIHLQTKQHEAQKTELMSLLKSKGDLFEDCRQ
jgi:hypothetical protein